MNTDKELLNLAAKAHGGLVLVDGLGWIHEDEEGNRRAPGSAGGAVVAKRRAKVDPLRDTYNRTLRVQIRCHQLGINAAEFQIAEQDGDRVPDFVQCEEGPSRARGRNKKLYTS